jgi:hypothetical protein
MKVKTLSCLIVSHEYHVLQSSYKLFTNIDAYETLHLQS